MVTTSDIADLIWAASGYILNVLGIGKLIAWGATVPSDADTGYGKGCIFIHIDGASNDTLIYVNVGSTTSCSFQKLSSLISAATQSISGVWTFANVLKTAGNVGTLTSKTGLTVTEYGDGVFHKTRFTFTNMALAITDEAGVVAYVGQELYTFPQGYIYMQSAVLDVALTKSSAGVDDAWDGDVGIGTTTAGNNNALATTEQDIIPTTATPQAAAGATTADAVSTATEHKIHDGTSAAKAAFLNFLVDDADHDVTSTPCNLIVNGTLDLCWVHMGDN